MADPGRTESRYYSTVALWAMVCILLGIILYFLTRPAPPEPPPPTPSPPPLPSPVVIPSPPSEPAPVMMIKKYYSLIDQDRFEEAYRMRSRKSWGETSFAKFQKTWANNESIVVEDVRILQEDPTKAVLLVRLTAQDQGHPARPYENTVRLVYEDGEWHYNGADVRDLSR